MNNKAMMCNKKRKKITNQCTRKQRQMSEDLTKEKNPNNKCGAKQMLGHFTQLGLFLHQTMQCVVALNSNTNPTSPGFRF
jgi:hypothetical protein